MGYRGYCAASGALFLLIALVHLLRIVSGTAVDVEGVAVPMLASWIGLLVPGALAAWGWRLALGSRGR